MRLEHWLFAVMVLTPSFPRWTEYMLPTHGAETRHIAVLDRQDPPIVVVPYWRSSKVARLQFRTEQEMKALTRQLQGQRR
jgi:streptogramin lyase